jgi:uncharacterized protein (DUF488 family)
MPHPFLTIGHSTRSVPEFVELLQSAGVRLVVDVRRVPRSRTNPQFNRDVLPESLTAYQIAYEHIAELGGLRGRQRLAEPSPNGFWENGSFRNYADYALSESFAAGLARLRELGAERRTAIMCAEAVWWRCHRRIIADYLLAAGEAVFHILGPDKIEEARMTPTARLIPGRGVIYPAEGTRE